MNRKFNIDNYLSEAEERFSGVDGRDNAWGGGGDTFSGIDEENYGADAVRAGSPAVAQGAPAKAPIPYQVIVTNTTGSNGTAVVFGRNKWLLTSNFGSSAGVTVTPSQTNISYLMLLQQSGDQPFQTQLIKMSSDNTSQIDQSFTTTTFDASGQEATTPLITDAYVSAYQNQDKRVELPVNLRIDGNSYISFSILASTTATITFFPSVKVNPAQAVVGAPPVRNYGRADVPFGGLLGYGKA
jgi:hypothetical protein